MPPFLGTQDPATLWRFIAAGTDQNGNTNVLWTSEGYPVEVAAFAARYGVPESVLTDVYATYTAANAATPSQP
jgi:hypothetical protein